MTLEQSIRDNIYIPAICAPMFLVTGPELVTEACKAGIIGGLPRNNARDLETFESWLKTIREELYQFTEENPNARIGPLAVNYTANAPGENIEEVLDMFFRYGVDIIISAMGNPTKLAAMVHERGGKIYHDVTNLRFAEKAIEAGVDGLTCIGSGGGGHSGTISHLSLIPKIRSIFDGTIILAGAVSTGAAIRAAEILGADLAYLGTRFIATKESNARERYKEILVSDTSKDVRFTDEIAGVAANWLLTSLREAGLDPDNLPQPKGKMRYDHLPERAKPWKNLWSAGQGIDLIDDIPSVAELVLRLRQEYVDACNTPSMEDAARLVDQAMNES